MNRRTAPQWTSPEWIEANLTLWIRSEDRCEWCGDLLDNSVARHHRMRRRDGGDTYANIVLLHPTCHRFVHANVDEARDLGFIVPTWDDPEKVPLLIRGKWFLLDLAGKRHPVSR